MRRNTFLFLALGLVSSVTMGVQGWTELSVKAQTELPVLKAQLSAPPLPQPPTTTRIQRVTNANYKDRLINLTQNWEDAKACVIVSAKINCFDSYAKADSFASSSAPAPVRTSVSPTACGTWIYVYEHAYYGGRRLQFRDPGYWQYYGTYGFRNTQSSWINTRCKGAYLYDVGTGGYYYMGANSRSTYMGSWNDRADYIRLY